MKNVYNAAIYCRLSREDENNTSQSESIKNQLDYLTRYVHAQGWNIAGTYIDDGYSGTSFDRPGFKRMVEDIEAGRVNLVITKDLSRLGRDYIETGRYMEKYFPEKSIRYIALNDGIDTFEDTAVNDITPFKSVINDLYARDISKKVRSVLRTKAAAGLFIGAFAPYGYKKDPANGSRLLVDEAAASVVRRIFKMYIEGHGLSCIAHALNAEKVPNPAGYKAAGSRYKNGRLKNPLWGPSTIKSILSNPTYAGNITQGKYKKASYKSGKLLTLDRSSWVTVKSTHEPVVSEEDFDLVQKMMSRRNTGNFNSKKPLKLFSGYVFCGDCGEYMTFTTTKKGEEYLICSRYKRYTSKYCSRHAISSGDLQSAVWEDMRTMVEPAIKRADIPGEIQKHWRENRRQAVQKDLADVRKKMDEIDHVIKNLYLDKVKGVLGEQEFMGLSREFGREKEALADRYNQLQAALGRHAGAAVEAEGALLPPGSLWNASALTRELLEKLVDKIEVFEDGGLKITYKFKNPLATGSKPVFFCSRLL
ncbi:MAG: recombinase family protein [Clostridiales bacterium]|jgi:DNA invertase Pin-like site-specific DNA recombinase|nr:recombinase family protein [Eubacteriales bacterium]MDH7567576.1 recombinase family protein [Clostridiales bacterium]